MPRVFTLSGVKATQSLNHFRHVNDADTVTSVPFDTNMDSWLFETYGMLGSVLGVMWTITTLPTVPLQKSLPDFGEVYCHQGNPVSFFKARQIGEQKLFSHTGASLGQKRWRMNGTHQFYLVPSLLDMLNDNLLQEQQGLIQALGTDKAILDEVFPQRNTPKLDTILTMPLDHFMGAQYQSIISNHLLSLLAPYKSPKRVISRDSFNQLINHADAYALNAKRNKTFMGLDDMLEYYFNQEVERDTLLQQSLERFEEDSHEINAE